jgi:nitrogen fixation/metabolism regulation signal transduction histidine kinase
VKNRLRNRLILLFLGATLIPLGATLWITTLLLDRSLAYSTTRQIDELSKSLEKTGRAFYQRARESLKADAEASRIKPEQYLAPNRSAWPAAVAEFYESGQRERFAVAGEQGDRLSYMTRNGGGVAVYTRDFGGIGMNSVSDLYSRARQTVARDAGRDLRRGFIYTFVLLAAGTWLIGFTVLIFAAHRVSRPIQQLTAGLTSLASGDLSTRVETDRNDEIGVAIEAFNHMAAQLEQSRERLVYLTRLASWQALARKMAHEVKNSLTPIRLTMEEVAARHSTEDRVFLEQAAQIIVEEVNSLERRVRAFSDFAAEPPVRPAPVNVNELVEERVTFLRNSHPGVIYSLRLAQNGPIAHADQDLIKGVLTNLIENAAQAAGGGGVVLCTTESRDGRISIEVHDSGPGLSPMARGSLFEPTISFKKGGMGLGLSIARKSAMLSGGDILPVRGELGGAAFRVVLPEEQSSLIACQNAS